MDYVNIKKNPTHSSLPTQNSLLIHTSPEMSLPVPDKNVVKPADLPTNTPTLANLRTNKDVEIDKEAVVAASDDGSSTNENMQLPGKRNNRWIVPNYSFLEQQYITDRVLFYHLITRNEAISHDWYISGPWKMRSADGTVNITSDTDPILPPGTTVLEGTMYCVLKTPPSFPMLFSPERPLNTIRTPVNIWRKQSHPAIDLTRSHFASEFVSEFSLPTSFFTRINSNSPAIGFLPFPPVNQ
jgi:hypothetical protein